MYKEAKNLEEFVKLANEEELFNRQIIDMQTGKSVGIIIFSELYVQQSQEFLISIEQVQIDDPEYSDLEEILQQDDYMNWNLLKTKIEMILSPRMLYMTMPPKPEELQ
jgi:hypothetical protein